MKVQSIAILIPQWKIDAQNPKSRLDRCKGKEYIYAEDNKICTTKEESTFLKQSIFCDHMFVITQVETWCNSEE